MKQPSERFFATRPDAPCGAVRTEGTLSLMSQPAWWPLLRGWNLYRVVLRVYIKLIEAVYPLDEKALAAAKARQYESLKALMVSSAGK